MINFTATADGTNILKSCAGAGLRDIRSGMLVVGPCIQHPTYVTSITYGTQLPLTSPVTCSGTFTLTCLSPGADPTGLELESGWTPAMPVTSDYPMAFTAEPFRWLGKAPAQTLAVDYRMDDGLLGKVTLYVTYRIGSHTYQQYYYDVGRMEHVSLPVGACVVTVNVVPIRSTTVVAIYVSRDPGSQVVDLLSPYCVDWWRIADGWTATYGWTIGWSHGYEKCWLSMNAPGTATIRLRPYGTGYVPSYFGFRIRKLRLVYHGSVTSVGVQIGDSYDVFDPYVQVEPYASGDWIDVSALIDPCDMQLSLCGPPEFTFGIEALEAQVSYPL